MQNGLRGTNNKYFNVLPAPPYQEVLFCVNHSGSDLSLGSTVLKDEGKTLSLLGREALGVVHGGLVVGVLL